MMKYISSMEVDSNLIVYNLCLSYRIENTEKRTCIARMSVCAIAYVYIDIGRQFCR